MARGDTFLFIAAIFMLTLLILGCAEEQASGKKVLASKPLKQQGMPANDASSATSSHNITSTSTDDPNTGQDEAVAAKHPSFNDSASRDIEDSSQTEQETGSDSTATSADVKKNFLQSLGDSCEGEQPALVTSLDTLQMPELAEPATGSRFRDPVFGTCMVRVTDRKKDISSDDDSKGIKTEYSRVQAFNADGSKFLLRGLAATWYLYDTNTLKQDKMLKFGGSVDPRWDADDPDTIYYIDGTFLNSYDITTDDSTELHDFTDDFPGKSLVAVWTRYEGSPSKDSRYWGLMAQDEDWKTVAFLIYDLDENKVVAKRELPSPADIDSVTISPLGNYFLAYFENYCEHGESGDDSNPCGFMVYDDELKNGRSLLRIIGHSDTAIDASGNEAVIYQDIDTDHISMLDLKTGKVTDLAEIDFSQTAHGFHFSGKSYDLPGWALVSTYGGGNPTDYTWMDDQIIAMELKENGRIARLGHHHSLYDENQEHDYWAEPHATANQDFTKILFTSNWGRTGTEEVDTYMIELPSGWADKIK